MKGNIHKFEGQWGETLKWSGARTRQYGSGDSENVLETWLIGKAEGAENFALRYYKLGKDGHSKKETHAHDHGILFLHGEGHVLLGDENYNVETGDVVYIPPNISHQIRNTGLEALGFLCIIPAKRTKNEAVVWAEEGLFE